MIDVFGMIRAYVLADNAIATAIGTRFYPIKVPQGTTALYPLMTMQRIDEIRATPLKGRASLTRPRFQFDIWTKEGVGSAYKTCQQLGALLLARLEGANFSALDTEFGSPGTPRLVSAEFITSQDLFETDVSGGYFRYSADYYIWHQTGHGGGTT